MRVKIAWQRATSIAESRDVSAGGIPDRVSERLSERLSAVLDSASSAADARSAVGMGQRCTASETARTTLDAARWRAFDEREPRSTRRGA